MSTPQKPRSLENRLRRHLARHNRNALGFALLSLVAAAFLWTVLYVALFSITLLALSIVNGTEAVAPKGFPVAFLAIAGALLFSTWLDRAVTVNQRPPDRKPPFEIFMDVLLAIPRTTFSIWENLSAWQTMSRSELTLAAELVERVARERRVPFHSIPIDIPDERVRDRIVFALLMVQVLDVRYEDGEGWLRLSALRSETLELTSGRPISN